MRELDRIVQALAAARERGEPAMLVTVLGVQGSVYRGAGARMVVTHDGLTEGAVSGGCLEADIAARAPGVIAARTPEVIQYDTRASDDALLGLGLGCQGVIDLLLEPLKGQQLVDAIAFYGRLAGHRQPVQLITATKTHGDIAIGTRAVLSEKGALLDGSHSLAANDPSEAWIARESIRPAVPLIICGGGADAIPLSRLARTMGFDVTVVDHRPIFATSQRFPDATRVLHVHVADDPSSLSRAATLDANTVAVVMAHSATHDRAYLHAMLDAGAGYIGVLGPRRRTTELLGSRFNGGLPPNVHSPVGIDIGAETPDEIALSIVAEIQAAITGRPGGMLRDRPGPIHERR